GKHRLFLPVATVDLLCSHYYIADELSQLLFEVAQDTRISDTNETLELLLVDGRSVRIAQSGRKCRYPEWNHFPGIEIHAAFAIQVQEFESDAINGSSADIEVDVDSRAGFAGH